MKRNKNAINHYPDHLDPFVTDIEQQVIISNSFENDNNIKSEATSTNNLVNEVVPNETTKLLKHDGV